MGKFLTSAYAISLALASAQAMADELLEVRLTKDEQRSVDVQVGQALVVRVPVNPSTGSVWVMETNTRLLQQASPPRFEVQRPMPGASGEMVFSLVGQQRGKADLHFTLRAQGPRVSDPITRRLLVYIH